MSKRIMNAKSDDGLIKPLPDWQGEVAGENKLTSASMSIGNFDAHRLGRTQWGLSEVNLPAISPCLVTALLSR